MDIFVAQRVVSQSSELFLSSSASDSVEVNGSKSCDYLVSVVEGVEASEVILSLQQLVCKAFSKGIDLNYLTIFVLEGRYVLEKVI